MLHVPVVVYTAVVLESTYYMYMYVPGTVPGYAHGYAPRAALAFFKKNKIKKHYRLYALTSKLRLEFEVQLYF